MSTSMYSDLLNSGLSIMHLNIQSLKPKLDILAVESLPYDIMVLTETWLSHDVINEDVLIPGFSQPVRCDRDDRLGGGVAIYVRQNINVTHRQDLSVNGLEAVWIELHVNNRKLLLGGIYRPPSANNNYWQLLEHSIDQAFNEPCDDILITGDFNTDVLLNPSNRLDRFMSSYNAHQLIDTPTHFTERSSSLIDLIFIKHPDNVISSFVADPFVPDLVRFHCPVVCVLKFNKPRQSCFKRRIWQYDRCNFNDFRQELETCDWNVLNNNDIEATADIISDIITSAASKTIPNKVITVRPNDIPWMNGSIRKLIRKRNRIHKIAETSNDPTTWANFRKIRNEVINLIRKTKSEYISKLTDKMNSDNTTAKEWFKLAKQVTKKDSSKSIPNLVSGNAQASSDVDKANLLNQYFCSQSCIDDTGHELPNIPVSRCSLQDISISVQDVIDSINSIDPGKACGPDLVSPRLIREGSNVLAEPLSIYFTKLLQQSFFPSSWKLANVTPIFKKSDPSKPNYRPVSLLSCIG
ncbi:uncharacterized protein LOC123562055 [Mercenaria mercenaria]|uniref:uncharacterized protein LOC123562055 n=1 Tax=Mercenaria mercenaria TaxID=6596 RepID=UPI00234EFF75|nr:uncharacterized protein LOC123562055 [Mercenaria mercenaria]